MYHQSDPLVAHVDLFSGFSWTRIIVPGGENGVQLKLKVPNSCSQAYIFRLIMDLRIRFIVVVACSKSLYQSYNGEFVLTLHNTSIKWFLDFRISCSAALCWCIFGGTN